MEEHNKNLRIICQTSLHVSKKLKVLDILKKLQIRK